MFRGHVELAGKLFDQVIIASSVGLLTFSCTKVGKGAVDTADDDGWTPLIIAASAGHNQLVEMLLANGANVNATTSQVGKRQGATSDTAVLCQGRSALLYCASKGRDELAARLIDAGSFILLPS